MTPLPLASSGRPVEGRPPAVRGALAALLAAVAFNAVAGGYYAVRGAEGVPVAWLEGSPFADYTIPGFILLVVVGGAAAVGGVAVFARVYYARLAALTAGLILLAWIGVQVLIIGYVSWLQPTMALAALVIVVLARRL